jgi:hypothetical protein
MHCGQQAARAPVTDWLERAAVGASILCLVHCAGLPLLLAALPALSRLIALPEQFHLWILILAIPASGTALLLGAVRHRTWRPLGAGCVGLALLSAGAILLLGGRYETPVTIMGSLCLVFAHIDNWRLRHRRHRHG